MKPISLILCVGLFSVVSEAAVDTLYLYEYCSKIAVPCFGDSQLMRDHIGRCGCISPGDYFQQKICNSGRVACDIKNGFSFSNLYVGYFEATGCGCFKTYQVNIDPYM